MPRDDKEERIQILESKLETLILMVEKIIDELDQRQAISPGFKARHRFQSSLKD